MGFLQGNIYHLGRGIFDFDRRTAIYDILVMTSKTILKCIKRVTDGLK